MRYHEIIAETLAVTPEQSLLMETSRAPLFHFTDRYGLLKIIASDTLGGGGPVSLTRDARLPFKGQREVVLVLDQQRIRHRHALRSTYGDSREWSNHLTPQDESEERLIKPLPALHLYLQRIVVSTPFWAEIEEVRPLLDQDESTLSFQDKRLKKSIFRDAVQVLEYGSQFGVQIAVRASEDRLWARRPASTSN